VRELLVTNQLRNELSVFWFHSLYDWQNFKV